MATALAPNQSAVLKALRTFLLGILPSSVEVILAQVNRVPEPKAKNFVLMTPTRRERLETNVDSSADSSFVASIAGNVMTVTEVLIGEIEVGAILFGVAANSKITSAVSGTGGVGTYKVSPAQTVASQKIAGGSTDYLQPTMVVVQLDVHGPDGADNAQTISTLFRDDYAVRQFASYEPPVDVVPLLADDPKQLPFLNAEQQYEDRWVVEALLQVNEVVTVPQQYADALAVDLINVDAAYPPS